MKAYHPLLLTWLITFITITLQAQEKTVTYPFDASYEIPDREIRLSHLDAHLRIEPYDTLVSGTAEFAFSVLTEDIDSLQFSVPEIQIDSIFLNALPSKFVIRGTEVIIYPPVSFLKSREHSVKFVYSAKPTDGLYFIGWNDPKQLKRKEVWAQRPGHWLPYMDGIITVNMAITVDDRYKVFNNGVREKVVQNPDHTKTWYYHMPHPHPFFSTALVIGDYDFMSLQTKRGLPLEVWYYPDWKDHVEPTYRYLPEMIDYFESEFGFLYPWELYREAPVIDYMYGAMETTTSTIFGDYLMVDKRGFKGRNYVNVDAHELAHQWFGNYISHLKTKDLWLTESFATYWAKKFEEHIFGEDYYQDLRNKEFNETFEAALHDNYAVGHSMGGRNRWYPKGSLVLDMLRNILGEEGFKASFKLYLESYPYQTAESYDFLQAIRKATGKSVEWFFEEWIYRGGEPEYLVSYYPLTTDDYQPITRISVRQTHETNEVIGLFRMPVEFEVHYTDGTFDNTTQWIREKQEYVDIPNNGRKLIDYVLFDPGRKILKKVTFKRSYSELVSQATKAEKMIDRYDAIVALRDTPVDQKSTDLIRCYKEENYSLIKGEIIAQLSSGQKNEIIDLLNDAILDPDDKVRLAVVQNLKTVPLILKENYTRLLSDSSYQVIELALENLCTSFPANVKQFLELTKLEEGWRGRNIRMKWLELAILNGQKRFQDELINYGSESYEFETRINSFNTLKRLNLLTDQAIRNMAAGLIHWNYKIHNAAADNLKYFYTQDKFKKMIDDFTRQSQGRIKTELDKIRAGS